MLPSLEPRRAAVRPRVFLARGGAPRLLEEEVGELLAARRTATVYLVGPPGSGRTTALRHLAACFADPMLHLADCEQPVPDRPEPRVRVAATTETPREEGVTAWQLAPWTVDDCLEYLLARWPARTGEVLKAWQGEPAPHDFLRWPGTCAAVLDAMAGTEPTRSPFEALDAALAALLTQDERNQFADRILWFVAAGAGAVEPPADPRAELASTTAQTELAAARLLEKLSHDPDALPSLRWPLHLANAVGRRLRAAGTLARELLGLVTTPASEQGTLLSALCAMKPGFRPPCRQLVSLDGARLAGADLHDLELFGWMQRIDLSGADLRGALLRHNPLDCAVLEGAQLAGATLLGITGRRLAAAGVSGAGMKAEHCDFHGSDFTGTDLERARLHGSSLRRCNLRGANLRGADLSGSRCDGADLDSADLGDADLTEAMLRELDLRQTCLRGGILTRANLARANLEGQQLDATVAEDATFCRADLTGTCWRGGRLRGANLANSLLAAIDWEGADLRDADFTGAVFHMGSSRSGLVESDTPSEGTRTGFYTDESLEHTFKAPEEVRKANLCGADLRGAKLVGVDFYLVDLRGAQLDPEQREWLRRCRAILGPRERRDPPPQS